MHLNIDPSAIPILIKQYPVLAFLDDFKTGIINGPVNIHPFLINPVCELLIKQILTCSYTGTNAITFLYRCCLDLLLNIAQQQAAAGQRMLFSTVIYGAAYQQLFKYLETHPHKQHTVIQLAYIFEIPAEQLAYGFVQLFAVSIEDFIIMTKMLFVYNRIQSKAFPYSLIADVTGYNSVWEMIQLVENYYNIVL